MRFGRAGGIVAVLLAAVGVMGCSSSASSDPAAFCSGYIAAAQTGASLLEARVTSVTEFQAKVRATDREVTDAVASAPKDIRSDVEALSQPVHQLRAQVDDATTQADIDDAVRAYGKAIGKLDAPRNAVEAWVDTNCGVRTATTAPPSTLGGITSSGSTIP